jgi:hypothetical protein
MRYAFEDLGHQHAGTPVTVRAQGSACNVFLVDAKNFRQYRAGQPFRYTGGHFMRTPVELEVPQDGHWYAVIDLGGYPGRVRASVKAGRGPAREARTEVHA